MNSIRTARGESASTTTTTTTTIKPQKASPSTTPSNDGVAFSEWSIKGFFAGSTMFPSFMLASDLARLIIFEVIGSDWCQRLPERLGSIGCLMTLDRHIYDLWSPIMEEWWHQEDVLEEKAKKWEPHRYHAKAPRLRTYREILNRQQALKNCCAQQLSGLEMRELLKNLVVHTLLIFCWMATMFRDSLSFTRLLRSEKTDSRENRDMVEGSIPAVVRRGELVMPRQGTSNDRLHRSLRRIQNQVDRGQRAITKFKQLKMCVVEREPGEWEESDWLSVSETSDDVPEEVLHANYLINRTLFSAGMAWLMVSISCEFATFYLFAIGVRIKGILFGYWGWKHGV